MIDREKTVKVDYESPALRVLGPLHALTLQDKMYGKSDGFTFMGVSITNASP